MAAVIAPGSSKYTREPAGLRNGDDLTIKDVLIQLSPQGNRKRVLDRVYYRPRAVLHVELVNGVYPCMPFCLIPDGVERDSIVVALSTFRRGGLVTLMLV